jgi:uncharacterized protein YgbK (DUF1537 family)
MNENVQESQIFYFFFQKNKILWYNDSMFGNRILIIADDLTGANDTAIQFVKHGMTALVVTDAMFCESSVFSTYDVLSFNSDSRGMSSKDAYHEVGRLIQRLRAARLEGLFYKKVDSVLRGNPGQELEAVMDELEVPLAIVSPSFPANRSVLEHGMLKSGRAGQSTINAVKIFADSMDKKADNIPLEIIRQGCVQTAEYVLTRSKNGVQVFVADAVTDDDLQVISRLSTAVGKPLILAGAAALANQIAQNMKRNQTAINQQISLDSRASVLVVAGTRQGETAAQIAALSETLSVPVIRFKVDLVEKGKSEEAIRLAFEDAMRYMESGSALCVVAVESMFKSEIPEGNVAWNQTDSDADSDAISASLGSLTGKLSESLRFAVMITTGGDTTLEICRSLGITGIQPLAEICPGIPIGKISGGNCEGRHIITKSGRFGNRDTLVEILKYVENWKVREGL